MAKVSKCRESKSEMRKTGRGKKINAEGSRETVTETMVIQREREREIPKN